jgi:hypothetical protein
VPFHLSSHKTICGSIDYHYLYGVTLSKNGKAISRRSALLVDRMLRHSSGSLREEAAPLRRAIDSHNEAEILNVVSHLRVSVCVAGSGRSS